MKKYFIVPIVQSEGMYGYSAIAIEITVSNLLKIVELQTTFKKVKGIDSNINDLTYVFYGLNFYLLNEDYEIEFDNVYIDSISDSDLNQFSENMDCSVDSPHINVNSDFFKIVYPAKHSDSYLVGTILFSEVDLLFDQLIK